MILSRVEYSQAPTTRATTQTTMPAERRRPSSRRRPGSGSWPSSVNVPSEHGTAGGKTHHESEDADHDRADHRRHDQRRQILHEQVPCVLEAASDIHPVTPGQAFAVVRRPRRRGSPSFGERSPVPALCDRPSSRATGPRLSSFPRSATLPPNDEPLHAKTVPRPGRRRGRDGGTGRRRLRRSGAAGAADRRPAQPQPRPGRRPPSPTRATAAAPSSQWRAVATRRPSRPPPSPRSAA